VVLDFGYAFQVRMNVYMGSACLPLALVLLGLVAGPNLFAGMGQTESLADLDCTQWEDAHTPRKCKAFQIELHLQLFCVLYTMFVFGIMSLFIYFGR
jgi:hypothetical protein